MISPPDNTSWSLFYVPVFEWEAVDPATDTTPPPAPACEGAESDPQQLAPADSPPEKRLVFKGYEWRPGWEYVLFPRAAWADCFNGGSYESHEESALEDRERRAQSIEAAARQHKPQLHPDHHHNPIEPTSTPPASTDMSESE
jgi:hypothetical protein